MLCRRQAVELPLDGYAFDARPSTTARPSNSAFVPSMSRSRRTICRLRSRWSSRWGAISSPGCGWAAAALDAAAGRDQPIVVGGSRPAAVPSSGQAQPVRRRYRPPTCNLSHRQRMPMTPIDGLSFQLYSARTFEPLEAQFELLAGLGYKQVEPFGGLFGDPQTAQAASSRQHSMSAPSCACRPRPAARRSDGGGQAVPGSRHRTIYAPAPPLGERDGGEAEWTRARTRARPASARSSPPRA